MPEVAVTQHKSDSSIEISKTSRGYNYGVKAYGETAGEITKKLTELLNKAKEMTQIEDSSE